MAKKESMVIETLAVIKDCKIKPECGDLNFSGFDYTSEQYKQIAEWVKGKEQLICSMRPAQENLPGM